MAVSTILGIVILCGSFVFVSAIKLNDNKYEDIYIVIEDNVEEDTDLLDQIQESFTKASEVLFKATRNHVYFGKIRIIIPQHWTYMPSYKSTSTVTLTNSHILIGTVKNQNPHVYPNDRCGIAGEFMHLSPTFIRTTRSDFGLRENVIVHEWGHLRWGLKDENPISGLPKFYDAGDERRPIKCSQAVKGTIGIGPSCIQDNIKCNLENSVALLKSNGCSFCPSLHQETDGASIMYAQYVDSLYYFCDKNGTGVPTEQIHDKIPRTPQNILCQSRSAWEVMREHADFANLSPIQSDIDTTPEFEIVHEGDGFRVLVLDVSGSMGGSRLEYLVRTSRYVIDKLIPPNSWLGIVTFSSSASISIGLTQINSNADRASLKNYLPNNAGGGTCIGCGIDEALSLLRQMIDDIENCEVLLISDGGNNEGNLDSSINNTVAAKVVVHTIAIEQNADSRLAEISGLTGGNHMVYLEVGQISFTAVFSEVISNGATRGNTNVAMILSENINSISSTVLFTFSIDDGLGASTSVAFIFTSNPYLTIELKGPNDLVQIYQGNDNEVTLDISGIAPTGDYEVTIASSAYYNNSEIVVVSSPTSDDGVIRLSTMLGSSAFDFSSGELPIIYANLNKNSFPILGAKVFATVEYNGGFCYVDLLDNGLDPDLTAGNGIYSGYIGPDCISNGRISIKTTAYGVGGEISLMSGYPSAASPHSEVNYESIESSFGRSAIAEELNVINYSPQSVDIIVPGQVTDLTVHSIDSSSPLSDDILIVTLQWSPTGDDKSYGSASAYDIRQSSDFNTFLDDGLFASTESVAFINFTGNTTVEHQLTINVTEITTNTYYVALKAVDDAGNYGPISNIVTINLQGGIVVDYGNNDDDDDVPEETTSDSNTIIIGVVVSVVLLLLILSSVFIYKFILKKKTQVLDIERSNSTSIEHLNASEYTSEINSHCSMGSIRAGPSYEGKNASTEMAVLEVDVSKEVGLDHIRENFADPVKNIDDQFGDTDKYIRFGVKKTHRLIPPVFKTPRNKNTNEIMDLDEEQCFDETDMDTEEYDSYIRQPQTPVPPMNWKLKSRNHDISNTQVEETSVGRTSVLDNEFQNDVLDQCP